MIEIRIPTSAAVFLLKEKIVLELKALQKANIFPDKFEIEDLSNTDLLYITETAAQDLIFTLPAEIYATDSNIADIIFKAIKTFAAERNSSAFDDYTHEQANALVQPIKHLFKVNGVQEVFSKN